MSSIQKESAPDCLMEQYAEHRGRVETQRTSPSTHNSPPGESVQVQGPQPGEDTELGFREKQQLDRYLSFIASLAFSATLLASWETTGGGLLAGLYNGGPSAIVYGLIVSIIGNLAIALSLAELASVHPTAGAQYHWTYVLAPRWPRFFSFFQGWITVFSWSALVCIAPFLIATQIEGMLKLSDPGYKVHGWRSTLLMWLVSIVPIVVNIFARRILGVIEIVGGIMHVVFLPIIIGIVSNAPTNEDSFAWDNFVSGLSGWRDQGVAFSIGLLGVITPLTGVDGIIHMAEEVKNAKVAVPRAMVWGTLINGLMAFGYAIAILYFMGSYAEALMTPTGYPIIEIAHHATGSKTATYMLMATGMLPGYIAFFNGLASVTRLTWAFARDNGLPFSDFFVKVDPRFKVPLRSLGLVASCIFVLSFIQTGSTAAFNAILSLSALGLYISYLFPLVFLIIARFTEGGKDVPRGSFSLGKLGLPLNLVAILFTTYFSVFLPFPPTLPVTEENMNFSGPVLGFIMLCACVDWMIRGRDRWTGPTMRYPRG
ncbi:amino acid/polyamine transporter I [Aspergillus undulatus]|uniref:amino acid/polyamine transporter I n=1 Tax=Aspergillus undulatus TaxID=1810928 RepID=UPI003CCD4AA4